MTQTRRYLGYPRVKPAVMQKLKPSGPLLPNMNKTQTALQCSVMSGHCRQAVVGLLQPSACRVHEMRRSGLALWSMQLLYTLILVRQVVIAAVNGQPEKGIHPQGIRLSGRRSCLTLLQQQPGNFAGAQTSLCQPAACTMGCAALHTLAGLSEKESAAVHETLPRDPCQLLNNIIHLQCVQFISTSCRSPQRHHRCNTCSPIHSTQRGSRHNAVLLKMTPQESRHTKLNTQGNSYEHKSLLVGLPVLCASATHTRQVHAATASRDPCLPGVLSSPCQPVLPSLLPCAAAASLDSPQHRQTCPAQQTQAHQGWVSSPHHGS